jgi:hypothetical protein
VVLVAAPAQNEGIDHLLSGPRPSAELSSGEPRVLKFKQSIRGIFMAASEPVPRHDLKAPILNSWKEIATYLGRGVRTVQRYEHEFHLPVRRVGTKSRKSVVALSHDLDVWLKCSTVQRYEPPVSRRSGNLSAVANSIARSQELRDRSARLRAEHATAISILMQSLSEIVRQIAVVTGSPATSFSPSSESESTARKVG